MNSVTVLVLVMGVALAPAAAQAHGDAAQVGAAGASKKEQMAWGIAGDAKAAQRTLEIRMSDAMRFTPDLVEVKQGETVRLVLRNDGAQRHEFVLGTKKELDAHAALMAKFPTMEHAEPYMAHVQPGKTGEIVWNFNRAGDFHFACLIPGHYQAGMRGRVKVAAAAADMTDGEVRKVDRQAGKLTLEHGEIKNLGMPGMTMVFAVKSKAMLDKLRPGDKVRFKAVDDAGTLTVTEIQTVN